VIETNQYGYLGFGQRLACRRHEQTFVHDFVLGMFSNRRFRAVLPDLAILFGSTLFKRSRTVFDRFSQFGHPLACPFWGLGEAPRDRVPRDVDGLGPIPAGPVARELDHSGSIIKRCNMLTLEGPDPSSERHRCLQLHRLINMCAIFWFLD
jgi:hypothetical protein